MKKYLLEISIGLIFAALITVLMHSTLAGIYPLLPWILLGVILIVLFGLFVPWPEKNADGTTKVRVREKYAFAYFAKSALASIAGIAFVVVLASVLSRDRFSKTFDVTERKVNSLSSETEKFVSSLAEPISIVCIPSQDPQEDYCGENRHLRDLYGQKSNGKISHTAIGLTPEFQPVLDQVKPSGYSRLVLLTQTGNRSEVAGKISESKLTNGIINLVKSKKVVYFLSGSGEPGITASGENGSYANVAEILKNRAYEVKEHSITAGELPEDAQMLVAGPADVQYSSVVENTLKKFVAKGGKLLLVLNPSRPTGLDNFLSQLGVKFKDNIILSNQGATSLGAQLARLNPLRPPVVIGDFSKESPITSVLDARSIGLTDAAREFTVEPPKDGPVKIKATRLMSAMHGAPVAITDAQRARLPLQGSFGIRPAPGFDAEKSYPVAWQIEIEEASKLSADVPVAALASKDDSGAEGSGDKKDAGKDTSEVVIMSFDLTGPYERVAPANTQVFPLAISHLYQDKELVSIPNKDFEPRRFSPGANAGLYLLLFAGILPVMTILAGVYIAMRRRAA